MKEKISITLNDALVKFIDSERGDVPRSKFIENYIKTRSSMFEALWIFSDELGKLSAAEWISAHASQPLGKPLHKHSGYVSVGAYLNFYDQGMAKQFSLERSKIRDFKVGYDSKFTRFRHSRGLNPPASFSVNGKKIYIFTRNFDRAQYVGDNRVFIDAVIGDK